MKVSAIPIPDVLLIEPSVYADERGYFLESWNITRYAEHGIAANFCQDNHSRSVLGTLRGLHFQLGNHAQGKLVRVSLGAVWDVVVDLRRSSPTYRQWYGVELSETNHRQLWIPPGLAHGFIAITAVADFQYKCTTPWNPSAERTLAWNDPDVAIDWPDIGRNFILSEKDQLEALSLAACGDLS
jgi:dTDP-4-dehydrorhamnose 3,5-epimerase